MTPYEPTSRIRRWITHLVWYAFFWWLLSDGIAGAWIIGGPVVILATLTAYRLASPWAFRLRLPGSIRFAFFFLWKSMQGSVDVAHRALHPARPIAPVLLNYTLRLPEGPSRLLFVSAINLMPGTLCVEMTEDYLLIHSIHDGLPVQAELALLEVRVADVFGINLTEV